MDKKIILHLCADIGSDSRFYDLDDSFEVIKIGKNIGVENYTPPKNVYGVIANPVCFTGDTLITTKRGLIEIKDVVVGDYVLTHLGRYRKVYRTMKSVSDHIRLIRSSSSMPTYTTDNHPYYTRKRVYGSCNAVSNNAPEFVEVQNLTDKNFLSFVDIKENSDNVDISDELLWLLGRYVADGWSRKDRNGFSKYEEISISVGKNKIEEFRENVKTLKFKEYNRRTAIVCSFGKRSFNIDMVYDFGKGAENKEIPMWIMELPIQRLSIFLKGYLSGDGYTTDKVVSASTISKKLAIGIANMMSKVYDIVPSIFINKHRPLMIIEGRKVNCKQSYKIAITLNQTKIHNYKVDGYSWSKPKIGERLNVETEVFNLSIEEDETYIANNCIVHNCTEFSNIQGRSSEHKDYEKGMFLVNHCLRIIRECKPVFWVIENPAKGDLHKFLGRPILKYQPWQFGSPWTKETALWGRFNIPNKLFNKWENVEKLPLYIRPTRTKPSLAILHKSSKELIPEMSWAKDLINDDMSIRSWCSQGFAEEFYKVNK